MGTATEPTQATLFIGLMYRAAVVLDDILSALRQHFGDVDLSYGPVPFIFTNYYKEEMGDSLKKIYLTFRRRIQRDELATIKALTNKLEERHSAAGARMINVDPGYITRDKLVLASTKDFYHRIYLAQGIFAEVTLHYRKGMFRFFSWTYPDYKDPCVLALLEKARAHLVKILREE